MQECFSRSLALFDCFLFFPPNHSLPPPHVFCVAENSQCRRKLASRSCRHVGKTGPGSKQRRFKMAASRWRTWDTDYFIDVIDSQLPEEGEIISAVGYGRGKPKKDISSLSLPRAALGLTKDEKATDENKLSESRGVGRGQALKERALLGTAPARRPGEKPPTNILKVHVHRENCK